jgi:hypothetical protein
MLPRRALFLIALVLVLLGLVFRRGFYAVDRLALELRYFWWLVLIIGGGLWLLVVLGRKDK